MIGRTNASGGVFADLSTDTVSPLVLAEGYTAHDATGAPIVGEAKIMIPALYLINGTEMNTALTGGFSSTVPTQNTVTQDSNERWVFTRNAGAGYNPIMTNLSIDLTSYDTFTVQATQSASALAVGVYDVRGGTKLAEANSSQGTGLTTVSLDISSFVGQYYLMVYTANASGAKASIIVHSAVLIKEVSA